MKRDRVQSSAISSIGHDSRSRRLEIEFRNGGAVYQYKGVSDRVASNLENARSIGRHFVNNIRDEYSFEKIRGARRRGRVKKHR